MFSSVSCLVFSPIPDRDGVTTISSRGDPLFLEDEEKRMRKNLKTFKYFGRKQNPKSVTLESLMYSSLSYIHENV